MRGVIILNFVVLWSVPAVSGDDIGFELQYLDSAPAVTGWAYGGDMDNDGDQDVVTGGGTHIYIYRNDDGAWTRFGNLDGTIGIGANGAALSDVDSDGDLDIVSAQYASDIGWWENPLEQYGELNDLPWTFHTIAPQDNAYMHDMAAIDLDGDGVPLEFVTNVDVGNTYWDAHIRIEWFRPSSDPTQPWESHTIEAGPDGLGRPEGPPHGHSGMDFGDIDGDGHLDLAFANGWYEAPDDPAGSWEWHEITDLYGISNTLLRDLNGDGLLDLVMSAGHHGFGVYWFAQAPGGSWDLHVIDAAVEHPEGLQVLDLDDDGILEVLAPELFFESWTEEVHNLYLYDFDPVRGEWLKINISPDSRNNHLFQLADVNGDCRPDIVSQTAGDTWVSVYENESLIPCPGVSVPRYLRGDVNVSGSVDVGDGVTLLTGLFDPVFPWCGSAADVNDDGALDVADATTLLHFLFIAGPAPEAPFPACGTDPTPDDLDCFDSPYCP